MPTDPYAIIHRNGADCQITYVASQWRARPIKPPDADEPRLRERVVHPHAPAPLSRQRLLLLVVAHLLERSADRIALTAVIAIVLGLLVLFIWAALSIAFGSAAKFRKQIFDRRVAGECLLGLLT